MNDDRSVTYPFITANNMSDERRLELLQIMFELGDGGGTIEITRGGCGVERRKYTVAPGEFWCFGPGYAGGRVISPHSEQRRLMLQAWGWNDDE